MTMRAEPVPAQPHEDCALCAAHAAVKVKSKGRQQPWVWLCWSHSAMAVGEEAVTKLLKRRGLRVVAA
jgi:hypothetical protein